MVKSYAQATNGKICLNREFQGSIMANIRFFEVDNVIQLAFQKVMSPLVCWWEKFSIKSDHTIFDFSQRFNHQNTILR